MVSFTSMDFELGIGFTAENCTNSADPCCLPLADFYFFFARNAAGHAALAGGKQKCWWKLSDPGKFRDVRLGGKQKGKHHFAWVLRFHFPPSHLMAISTTQGITPHSFPWELLLLCPY